MKPRVTIVTISYNQGRYLEEAIKSVVSQKEEGVEYIIVDPGSTDNSRTIIERYRAAIDRVLLEPDRGPADGLQKGFALATGEVGYFLNADDFLLPRGLEAIRELWERADPRTGIVAGAGWMVDESGRRLRRLCSRRMDNVAEFMEYGRLFQQGMSFRMEAFKSVGGFNVTNRTCWDYELVVDMLAAGWGAVVTKVNIGAFRLHGESLTGSRNGAVARRYREDRRRIAGKMEGIEGVREGPVIKRIRGGIQMVRRCYWWLEEMCFVPRKEGWV